MNFILTAKMGKRFCYIRILLHKILVTFVLASVFLKIFYQDTEGNYDKNMLLILIRKKNENTRCQWNLDKPELS